MQTLEQLLSGKLKGSKSLKLSCGLKDFPEEIYTLSDTLEILDLSGNYLNSLPDDFGRLKKLRIAFFSFNDFAELPAVLGDCPELSMIGFKSNKIAHIPEEVFTPHLRWLILTDNRIESLPSTIGKCIKLQKCALAGNRLKELPSEMVHCQNLELLRISANNLQAFPEWLLSLPKLTWLAYAGNNFNSLQSLGQELEDISWNDVEIQQKLGEGASGIISKAIDKRNKKEVAVKVFKGEVTSDGYPEDEMYACIAAGVQDSLVKVIGKLKEHPDNKQGLVLELIPPNYKNLGLPPSFETCTRDVFPEDTSFSIEEIIKVSKSIASACSHLHSCGILHGDLYAHNTLIDENANTLLGDFGAATAYDKEDKAKAFIIERLDVRAFGCLLEDLLKHCSVDAMQSLQFEKLLQLKNNCMTDVAAQRPAFNNILERILNFETLIF